ncbi:hypothetical protein [Leifsonia shinshuensis]|uniref:WapI family immunity protein n=1 Tax=Leifsonia shinshuensis TaxID=150026 RepID=UPI002865F29F|nr:hypothetical protein [Leifsonia shinshuensis]MDR6971188.1 hypothetical protein [Leifsonia shinshuensis]
MKLQDEGGTRSVELRPAAREDGGGEHDDGRRIVVDAVVHDDARRWTLSEACLTTAEARDLAAWLAGLAEDTTADADEWTAIAFASNAVSMSGHRIPGGTVDLRIAVLRMLSEGTGTTDVVVGLRTSEEAVIAAARELIAEVDALAERRAEV